MNNVGQSLATPVGRVRLVEDMADIVSDCWGILGLFSLPVR